MRDLQKAYETARELAATNMRIRLLIQEIKDIGDRIEFEQRKLIAKLSGEENTCEFCFHRGIDVVFNGELDMYECENCREGASIGDYNPSHPDDRGGR